MELILVLVICGMNFILSLTALILCGTFYIKFKSFIDTTQAVPMVPDVNQIAKDLFNQVEDIPVKLPNSRIPEEELV